jgi:hypothetical protein
VKFEIRNEEIEALAGDFIVGSDKEVYMVIHDEMGVTSYPKRVVRLSSGEIVNGYYDSTYITIGFSLCGNVRVERIIKNENVKLVEL